MLLAHANGWRALFAQKNARLASRARLGFARDQAMASCRQVTDLRARVRGRPSTAALRRPRFDGRALAWLLAFALSGCGKLDLIPIGDDLALDAGVRRDATAPSAKPQCAFEDAGYPQPTEQLSDMLARVCQSAPLAPGCPLQVCKTYVEADCVNFCVAYILRLLELRYGPLDASVPRN